MNKLFNFFKLKKKPQKKSILNSKGFFPPESLVCGDGVIVKGIPIIVVKGGKIRIGNNVVLNSDPIGYHVGMPFPVTLIADKEGANIVIGEDSRIHGACLHAFSEIKVGKRCLIAAGCNIMDSNGHSADLRYARLRQRIEDSPQGITIEDDCWLATNVVVLKGVTIGSCSIIGANSVVTESIPPYSIAMGNPAKVVRKYSEEKILSSDLKDEDLKELGLNLKNYK